MRPGTKTTGDGLLVEFASVVDAVRCAIAVQQAMAERETGVAADSRIELRIGINLGDVIVEDDDHYATASRLVATFLLPGIRSTLICAREGSRVQAVAGAAWAAAVISP